MTIPPPRMSLEEIIAVELEYAMEQNYVEAESGSIFVDEIATKITSKALAFFLSILPSQSKYRTPDAYKKAVLRAIRGAGK